MADPQTLRRLILVTEEFPGDGEIFSGQGGMVMALLGYLKDRCPVEVVTLGLGPESPGEDQSVTRIYTALSRRSRDLAEFFAHLAAEIDRSYVEFSCGALGHLLAPGRSAAGCTVFLQYGYATGMLCRRLSAAGYRVIVFYHSLRGARYLKGLFASGAGAVDVRYDLARLSLPARAGALAARFCFGSEKRFFDVVALCYRLRLSFLLPRKARLYYENEIEPLFFADRVIVNSRSARQDLADEAGSRSLERVSVLYPGVDEGMFAEAVPRDIEQVRQACGLEGADSSLLFLGRINPMKGLEYFLAALALLEAAGMCAERKIRVCIAGTCYGAYAAYLERLKAMALTLRSITVSFPGPVHGRQKLALYDACTAFVLPSVYEPFGIVALEAMARKKPVIFSSACGVGEIIPPGAGMRVDFSDAGKRAERLAEAISGILTKDAGSMATQARGLAMQYRWSERVGAYADALGGQC